MPRIPIPNDWSGDGWRCVRIQWPDSPLWIALLIGFITTAQRGWYWDERTGSIIDVKDVGLEIFARNFPLNDCRNGVSATGEDDSLGIGGAGCDDCEDCMSCITNVTIEDGNLYIWFGPCCQILVGPVSDIGGAAGAGEVDPSPPSGWPCNKARGMADEFAALAVVGVTELIATTPGGVAPAAPYLQAWLDVLPGVVWEQNYLWQAVVYYSNNETVINLGVTGAEYADWLACKWATVLGDTSGLSVAEFEAMQSVITGIPNAETATFTQLLMQAMQYSRFSFWAQAYYLETAACNCPEAATGETEPTAGGWYFSAPIDLTIACPGGAAFGYAEYFQLLLHDIYGCMFEYEKVSGDPINRLKRSNDDNGWTNYDTFMYLANSDFDVVATQYLQCGPNAFAELEDLFDTPIRKTNGEQSDVVGSPAEVAGNNALAINVGQATGDPAEVIVKFTLRWLHNSGSPSHS